MSRRTLTCAIALVAVWAFSATAVTAASANTRFFHAEGHEHTLGTGIVEAGLGYTFNAGELKCSSFGYTTEIPSTTSETLTVSTTEATCKLAGLSGTTIAHNGCAWTFHAERTEPADPPTVTIECPAGKEVIVVQKVAGVTKCTIRVPPQGSRQSITFTNEGSGATRTIIVHFNLTGLEYSQTAGTGSGACTTAGGLTNGQFAGTVTLTGEDKEHQRVGIWYE